MTTIDRSAGLPGMAPTVRDRQSLIVGTLRVTCLLTADETAGQYSLFEIITPPHDPGPPPHTHTLEDEAFYVLDGQLTVTVDGVETVGGPGSWLLAPRFKPHGFRNDGDTPTRMLMIASPGGFEHFFNACGIPATNDNIPTGPPTDEQVRLILDAMPRYGMTPHL